MLDRARGGYDTAQICLNGHLITGSTESYPEKTEKFCHVCGARTITACTRRSCQQGIRGYYRPSYMASSFERVAAPRMAKRGYCHRCGKPYPWTQKLLTTFDEVVETAGQLEPADERELSRSLRDVVVNAPRSPAAADQAKRIVMKLGGGVRDLLWDVAKEGTKRGAFDPNTWQTLGSIFRQ